MNRRAVAEVEFGPDYVLRAVAAGRAFRSLVLWLGLIYLLGIGRLAVAIALGGDPSATPDAILVVGGLAFLASFLVQLAAEIMMLVYTWRLAGAMNRSAGLWLLAMFLPLINLIGLVRLSQMAQEFMGRVNVSVGLLGPHPHELDALEASVLASGHQVERP